LASYSVIDDESFTTVTAAPDATYLVSAMTIPDVMSKSDMEPRGDAAVDASPMGTGRCALSATPRTPTSS
jgi:hypothetical protein